MRAVIAILVVVAIAAGAYVLFFNETPIVAPAGDAAQDEETGGEAGVEGADTPEDEDEGDVEDAGEDEAESE